jgi:hypothetical protein
VKGNALPAAGALDIDAVMGAAAQSLCAGLRAECIDHRRRTSCAARPDLKVQTPTAEQQAESDIRGRPA